MRISDWSSDVCSSDLITYLASTTPATSTATTSSGTPGLTPGVITIGLSGFVVPRILEDGRVFLQLNMSLSELVGEIQSITRSEARRVGKECGRTCRSWRSPNH